MKKNLLFLCFAMLALGACSPNSDDDTSTTYDPYLDDPIKLEKDTSEGYTFADSSNENGSMNYELFVRSFYDGNGDGIGDLKGVKEKIPYLADMGYKSVWLMPICPSPTYHGYDITNYYAVNPDYGTLDDFDALVAEASNYNIDIMIDMVFNHCSIKNPYFTQAFSDYTNGDTSENSKANWFNFGPGGDHVYQGVPYESRFDASMPDFNLDCQAVRDEIENITKFWIGHGVKGFRLDAVLYYYYNLNDKNVEFLSWLEDTAHKYDPNFYMVGECWSNDTIVNDYFKSKCDSFFRFGNAVGGNMNMINMIKGYTRASAFADEVEKNENAVKKYNPKGYSSYFLSNHDMDRVAKNFNEDTNKVACSLYSMLPGTSYTYYGEEILLKGKRKTSPDDQSDVRRRLPMIWDSSSKVGECSFPEKNRLDLSDNEQVTLGVEDQKKDGFSLLNHYKMMIHLRNKYSFIKYARFKSLVKNLNTDNRSVLAYSLEYENQKIILVHNMSNANVEVDAVGTEILEEINVSHQKPSLSEGKLRLGAFSSVILK